MVYTMRKLTYDYGMKLLDDNNEKLMVRILIIHYGLTEEKTEKESHFDEDERNNF